MTALGFSQEIQIGNRVIRKGGPCFVIAEAGINHNGEISLAKKLVDIAVLAGADAVKFQTFIAEEEVTKELQKVTYQKNNDEDQESYFDMIKKLEFTEENHRELIDYCNDKNIIFLSTPSDMKSAVMLEGLGVPAFKIASNDLVTTPQLEQIAEFGKPIILSTGMGTIDEVQTALDVIASKNNREVIVLQCTSNYPTAPADLNLNTIDTLAECGTLIGFSDHSEGVIAAKIAVLKGAVVVEKHITIDHDLPGPDQKLALELPLFREMIISIRHIEKKDLDERARLIAEIPNVEIYLGSTEKKPSAAELIMRQATRKSIVARHDLKKGTVINFSDLAFKRPAVGLPPNRYRELIGKVVTEDLSSDSFFTESSIK